MNLIENPHLNLKPPLNYSVYLVKGCLKYFHYNCDGFDDRGWGCGYRTLQTIFSWIIKQQGLCEISDVPSIFEIQKALVDMSDKPQSFIGSREWIGSIEVTYCIDFFYKVPCRIMHTRDLKDLKEHAMDIVNHFVEFGSPVMMGGDEDCSSKCILGISMSSENILLLILERRNRIVYYLAVLGIGSIGSCAPEETVSLVKEKDPHYFGSTISRDELQSRGWIKWQLIDSLNQSSFYNLCFPLLKAKH